MNTDAEMPTEAAATTNDKRRGPAAMNANSPATTNNNPIEASPTTPDSCGVDAQTQGQSAPGGHEPSTRRPQEHHEGDPRSPVTAHLDGPSVGELAARTGVRRVLLTHLLMDFDPDETTASVRGSFGGPVVLVEPGDRFTVGS